MLHLIMDLPEEITTPILFALALIAVIILLLALRHSPNDRAGNYHDDNRDYYGEREQARSWERVSRQQAIDADNKEQVKTTAYHLRGYRLYRKDE